MSEETENTESVETQEPEAPLINVDAKDAEPQEEAPMPLHDEPEEQELSEEDDDETVQQIKHLLDTRVRPAVAMDGGDITFHSFEDGVVTLQMRGACQGCPSSTATLKMGIENMLRHYIPEVREVRPTDS